ncbi:hypothetical protein L2E82_08024 [Cichorium intybus]|uniref:Uncharacterized protein n=1 Tax=Cichorium intybus TaxID=13427 RepID=A0ACB9G5F0_CICIN|nr:hypothetical protein L2E82_08024 [Cichorium intybus]
MTISTIIGLKIHHGIGSKFGVKCSPRRFAPRWFVICGSNSHILSTSLNSFRPTSHFLFPKINFSNFLGNKIRSIYNENCYCSQLQSHTFAPQTIQSRLRILQLSAIPTSKFEI